MATTFIYGKILENSLLQNQKADDLGTRYVAFGVLGLLSFFQIIDLLNVKVQVLLLKPKSLFLLDMFNLTRQWLQISFKGQG